MEQGDLTHTHLPDRRVNGSHNTESPQGDLAAGPAGSWRSVRRDVLLRYASSQGGISELAPSMEW